MICNLLKLIKFLCINKESILNIIKMGSCDHLQALMTKNFILMKRNINSKRTIANEAKNRTWYPSPFFVPRYSMYLLGGKKPFESPPPFAQQPG